MASALTTGFTASDGRSFEVTWNVPEHAAHLWRWNQDHYAEVMSPLEQWLCLDPPGRIRAYEEADVAAPFPFRGFEVFNGFQYARADLLAGAEQQEFVTKSRTLAARFGGACKVWEAYSLPKIRECCDWMRNAPVETSVRTLGETFNYAFHLTQVGGPTVYLPLQGRAMALLAPAFEAADITLLVQELGQGSENATVASDRAIAQLAGLAREHPALSSAILAAEMPHREAFPEAGEFFDELERFFDEYGERAQSWGIDHPTMREDPSFVWGMIRAALVAPAQPDDRRSAGVTRDKALARIRAGVADSAALAEIETIAEELRDYVTVREGRALWQLVMAGILRTKLLEKGDSLVARGVISIRDDILFLLPDEIDPFFEIDGFADYRALVAERRGEEAAWHGVTPPRLVSGDPSLLPAAAAVPPNVVAGLAGARGRVTATARVVLNLDDAYDLEPGEVLVCEMTTPAWTPLFGLACAIVTDSGMALSHPAIAAREYGIPCVVGTAGATKKIRSGDTITVDGDAGTVTIL